MEPKVLASDAPDRTAPSRGVPWLPGILAALAALIALFVVVGASSAQEGPDGTLADPSLWATGFCQTAVWPGMQCAMGDFNGDGKDDIIQFNHQVSPAGRVYVRLSNGSSFNAPPEWPSPSFCEESTDICKVADFNGDGLDDIVRFRRSTGDVAVAISNGLGFEVSSSWVSGFCVSSEICDVGDYNGDGKADVSAFTRNVYCTTSSCSWGKVYVATSDGTKFNKSADNTPWRQHFCASYWWTEICGSGDFNGDGKDDIVAFNTYYGQAWVALSTGSGFGDSSVWTPEDKSFCLGQETCGVGDFDGDGKDDIITYLRSLYSGKDGWVFVARSNGSRFPADRLSQWSSFFCIGSQTCGSGRSIDGISQWSYIQASRTGDFNGDGSDDVVAFLRNSELSKPGWVYVKLAYGNQFVDPFVLPVADWLPLIFR